MKLASEAMTPLEDKRPVTVKCKVYWIHTQLWNDKFIARYHADVAALAREIAGKKVNMSEIGNEPTGGASIKGGEANRFSCEDFAFEILVKFASQNKLPLKIRTRSAIFKNIDKDYESGSKVAPPTAAGFSVDLALATGASDIALNCIPVTEADLKAGDLFLEFNKEHVQVLVDVR